MEKKVTFIKIFGVLFLACSGFILFTSIAIGPSINTITGVILLFVSIFYLVNPALVYTDDELQVKNLMGMTLKRHSFINDKFTIDNRDIFINGKKLRVGKGMLVQKEYNELLAFILLKNGDDDLTGEQKSKPLKDDNVLDSDII